MRYVSWLLRSDSWLFLRKFLVRCQTWWHTEYRMQFCFWIIIVMGIRMYIHVPKYWYVDRSNRELISKPTLYKYIQNVSDKIEWISYVLPVCIIQKQKLVSYWLFLVGQANKGHCMHLRTLLPQPVQMKKLQNAKVLCILVALAGHTTSCRYPFIPADLTRVGFSHLCTCCQGRYKFVAQEMCFGLGRPILIA